MAIFYTQKQACKYLNVSRMTILRWEEKGLLSPVRFNSGHRRYPKEQLDRLFDFEETEVQTKKTCVIYARVSTKKQEITGNLERQMQRLMEHASLNGYEVIGVFEEVASGINENRRQLNRLLQKVASGSVDIVLAEYKDRIARFGYSYIETFCKSHQTEIHLIENQEQRSLNEEMVEDMISIITSFSARLYGQRGARKIRKQMKSLDATHVIGEEEEDEIRE